MQYWWLYFSRRYALLSSRQPTKVSGKYVTVSSSPFKTWTIGHQGLCLFQILLMMMISLVMSLKAKIIGSASGTSDIFLESKCQMVRSLTTGLPKDQIIITTTGFSMETMIWSCTRQYTWTGGRLIIEDGTFWKIQIGEVQHKQNNLIQQNELNRTH